MAPASPLQQLAARLRRPRESLAPLAGLSPDALSALSAQIESVCRQDADALGRDLARLLPGMQGNDTAAGS